MFSNYIKKNRTEIEIKNLSLRLLKGFAILLFVFTASSNSSAQENGNPLRIIIIRHAEKPVLGDNLNCQGLNRALLLPDLLVKKFGVPTSSYVPAITSDSSFTKHARMLETIMPLAVRYNLGINSRFSGRDSSGLVTDLLKKNGNVLVIWDHKSIIPIIHAFGINDPTLKWDDGDYDSIWIITFVGNTAVLSFDKENLSPLKDCR